jgi:hypothetical protein
VKPPFEEINWAVLSTLDNNLMGVGDHSYVVVEENSSSGQITDFPKCFWQYSQTMKGVGLDCPPWGGQQR